MSETRFISKEKSSYEFCSIREIWPKDSKKVLLALWSLFHRTKYSWWNLSDIVAKEFQARFVSVDWPKQEYNSEKVINQLIDYIENCGWDEIIISWLSFWDIVCRDLIDKLPQHLKSKVKLHLSVCWVSSFEELALPPSLSMLQKVTSTKIWNLFLKWVIGAVWKVDRKGLVLNKWKWIMSKGMVAWSAKQSKHKLARHQKVASLWITPWAVDRFSKILSEKNNWKKHDIPVYSLYSTDDPTFKNSQTNAESIVKNSSNNMSAVGKIINWWHAWLVEFPDQWDNVFRSILNQIWLTN